MSQASCKYCKSGSLNRIPKTLRQTLLNHFFAIRNYQCDNCGRRTSHIVSYVPKLATYVLFVLLGLLVTSAIVSVAEQKDISFPDKSLTTDQQQPDLLNPNKETLDTGAMRDESTELLSGRTNNLHSDEQLVMDQVDSFTVIEPLVSGSQSESIRLKKGKDNGDPETYEVESKPLTGESTADQPVIELPQFDPVNDEEVLLKVDARYFTIQIASISDRSETSELAAIIASESELNGPIFIYRSPKLQKIWYPVFYGYFESREEANENKFLLPDQFKQNNPYVRQLSAIQKVIREG